MRRPANRNLPAFDKTNPRLPGFHSHVATAAQYRFHLPADNLHAHGPGHRDILPFDDAHGIARWLVGRGRNCNKNRDPEHRTHDAKESRAPRQFAFMLPKQHS
jgi:hypothetical protein